MAQESHKDVDAADVRPWYAPEPGRFGFDGRCYRSAVWAFVCGSCAHLLLPRVWQWSWLPADAIYLAGLVLLVIGLDRFGWVACAIGVAMPLLFLGDPLTQSVILLAIAVAGTIATWAGTPVEKGNEGGDGWRTGWLRAVRWITIATYGLAAFHKVNSAFLDPETSCGVDGLNEVFAYWRLGSLPDSGMMLVATPVLVIAAEAAIAVFHAMGFRRIAWPTAVAFHVTLTLTLAPAFVFVMLAGHAAFVREDDLADLWRTVRRRGFWLAVWASGATLASVVSHGDVPPATFLLREWSIWALLGLLVTAFPPYRTAAWERGGPEALDRGPRWLPIVVAGAFVCNGLTPYLGLQYQHTGAMVSNLRIDRECWNHLLVPESVRLRDPYIRVDEVYFGEPGRDPEYEDIVRRQLWSPPQILQMRRNWCKPSNEPLYLRGTYRGEPFEIENLCQTDKPPFDGWFGDALLFQKNLRRTCRQQCIH